MSDRDRSKALKTIRRNIERSGFHIYLVDQHSTPRFAYTIGLTAEFGAELVIAGAIFYMGDEVLRILHAIREQLRSPAAVRPRDFARSFEVERLGAFTLGKVHPSWTRDLLLGAIDYYPSRQIAAYQIVPDKAHRTNDVPDMSKEWSATEEPVWRWLREPWPYSFPETSTATTNLAALRGERITEAARWEEDEWEIFAGAGPDVDEKDVRVVPVTSLVGADPSVAPVLSLDVGKAIWRDAQGGGWNAWEKSD